MQERKKVLIDGFFLGKPYGFGRYSAEMLRALSANNTAFDITVLVPEDVTNIAHDAYPRIDIVLRPRRNFIVWEQIVVPNVAKDLGIDIIHYPYNTCALRKGGRKTVTTVHDIIFLLEGGINLNNIKASIASAYARLIYRFGVPHSDAVIAVSKHTQKLIKEMSGVESIVAYNTVDGFLESVEGAPNAAVPHAERTHFLHRGGDSEHRNTKRVMDAFTAYQQNGGKKKLMILGVPEHAPFRVANANQDIAFLERVSDGELQNLYRTALAVVVASLEEGFGLPILESIGLYTPAIVSNRSPMTEVVGDAGLLIDPLDVDSIARAMTDIDRKPALFAQLLKKGEKQVKVFSSVEAAKNILQAYRSVA